MLTINTNLSSLIAQSSMKQSIDKLNQAIERMTTGFKINHASDNAANYSISTNMTTKINSYMVAEDNAAMGLDMTTAISENLDLINQHASRIRDLCEQASNGTYGEDSLKAIQAEIESRMTEIERIKANAEFNGIKLFEAETNGTQEMRVTGSFIEEVTQLTEEEAIAQGYTIIKTADELQAMQDNLTGKYILMNDIDLSGVNWNPINNFNGELNGNGFVIKNLTLTNNERYAGLFRSFYSSASILNLGIVNAKINTSAMYFCAGILVSELQDCMSTQITNCYATGEVATTSYAGGLIGICASGGNFEMTNCWTDVTINASGSDSRVGGLCGFDAYNLSKVTNCFTKGLVYGSGAGGLFGHTNGTQITNSYSLAEVSGSTVGGIIGTLNAMSPSSISQTYWNSGNIAVSIGNNTIPAELSGNAIAKTQAELQAMIDNGTLVSAKAPPPPPIPEQASITLQVGISSDAHSQILMNLVNTLIPLSITVSDSISARDCLTDLDTYLSRISDYQTEIGAVQNRLESVLEEITIQRDNLISSRSTIRDADIADVSSQYIQQQILQQASATLLATANQSPSIALQLI